MSATPDLIVNGLALVAAGLAVVPMAEARRTSPVAARMLALLVGLTLLLAARLLAWSGHAIAAVPLMLVASWLPLLALRVAEQLVRRHAPAWMKWLVLGGGVAFTILSLVAGASEDGPVLIGLSVFQATAILCAVGLLVTGRRDISPAEATLTNIFAAALLVALPLSASDFRAFTDLPVRGGAFAVLVLVLATSRFVDGTAAWRALAIDLAVVAVSGAVLAGGALAIWPAVPGQAIQLAAIGAATAALALIVQRRSEARLVTRARPSLIAALAPLPDAVDVDAVLSAHPLLASGRLVEGYILSAYPDALVTTLADRRVATRDDGDAARDLLDAHAGTHLVRLGRSPPRFLAVSAGGLSGDTLTAELDMVARIIGRSPA